jgi:hypothetical protein
MGSSVSSPRDGSVSTNSEFSSFSSAYKSGPESPPFSNASRSSWNSFAAARMPNSNPKPCSNNDGNGAHGAKVHMIASGWNFTKSMVVSVLPRFLNDKNSSSDSGGHFNKGRTMTSLSGDTIISSGNNISSGYASVTNSSGSSRSSSPLDPFNEEHQPGFNHDTTNVILRSGKPNYPQSPYIKTEMVVAKHISKNTAKRNSSLLEGDKVVTYISIYTYIIYFASIK